MDIPYAKPKSRLRRKQIAAYPDPDLAWIVRKAVGDGMTIQDILGNAIDDWLDRRGMGRPLSPTRLSLTRRRLVAKVRREDIPSRKGRVVVAGWYPASSVDRCIDLAARSGLRLNALAVAALEEWRDARPPRSVVDAQPEHDVDAVHHTVERGSDSGAGQDA